MSKNRFAINAATLMSTPFPAELSFYRGAGFDAVEVWLSKIRTWMAGQSATPADARQLIAEAGLEVIGACAIGMTMNDPQSPWEQQQAKLIERLDLAAALGAPRVAFIIGGTRTDAGADLPALVERCRWLADRAGERRITIALEFLARLGVVNCLSTAIRLIREVDRASFGLLFDLYHYHLSESRLEDLAQLPKGGFVLGHLDDARALPIEWLTQDDRTFPGEGSIACADLLGAVADRTGFAGPWSVELHSDWVWKLPAEETMERLGAGLARMERG